MPTDTPTIADYLENQGNEYKVYQCKVCGKVKPNPWVILSEGFGCECAAMREVSDGK